MNGAEMLEDTNTLNAGHCPNDRTVLRTVAALYVEPKGCYIGAPGVDPWDEARDARTYTGPHPVVAHPPCQRWGRFWHGSTRKPPRNGGWVPARTFPAPGTEDWTCCVYQGHYGHPSGKATWLYVSGVKREDLPMLTWGKTEQRLPEWMIERYGYEKARRIGVVAMIGGKNKTAIRNATPEPFRDLLLAIARASQNTEDQR